MLKALNSLSNRKTFIKRRKSKYYNWISQSPEYSLSGFNAKSKLLDNLKLLHDISPELFQSYDIDSKLNVYNNIKCSYYTQFLTYGKLDKFRDKCKNKIQPIGLFYKATPNGVNFFFIINHFLCDALSSGLIAKILCGDKKNHEKYLLNNFQSYVKEASKTNKNTVKYNNILVSRYNTISMSDIDQRRFRVSSNQLESTTVVLGTSTELTCSEKYVTPCFIKAIATVIDDFFGGESLYLGLNQHCREPTLNVDPRYSIGWLNEVRPILIEKSAEGYLLKTITQLTLNSTLFGRHSPSICSESPENMDSIPFPKIGLNVVNTSWFSTKPKANHSSYTIMNDAHAYRIFHIGFGLTILKSQCKITVDYSSKDYKEQTIQVFFEKLMTLFLAVMKQQSEAEVEDER